VERKHHLPGEKNKKRATLLFIPGINGTADTAQDIPVFSFENIPRIGVPF
jgi:hypothetical protein